MTSNIRQFRVFISCPDDVLPEMSIVEETCAAISKGFRTRNIHVKSIHWQSDLTPRLTDDRTQAEINRQLEEYYYDVYIGLMWHRFGEKQENGMTHTEEEFQHALATMKQSGRPVVKFYFKQSQPDAGAYDESQLEQVKAFQKMIQEMDCGVHGAFETEHDFRAQIFGDLLYVIDNFERLVQENVHIPKIQYKDVSGYLPRRVIRLKDNSASNWLRRKDLEIDACKVILQDRLIVVLGDAGVGKTTELQRIAAHYSQQNAPLHPYLLPLNRYVDKSIGDLLPDEWVNLPDALKLIILDGFDEIEAKNRHTAARHIESYVESHPDLHLVISCRSNFYRASSDGVTGTLSYFEPYVVQELDRHRIEEYSQDKLGTQSLSFLEEIHSKQLSDLLEVPFYLIHLVDMFKELGHLPAGKPELFGRILETRTKLDLQHFRTTIELEEKRTQIFRMLERVALGMESLGRNYISNKEFIKLLPDESSRDLLRYCTAWRRIEGEPVTWQFDNNSIQEFLAARALSSQPLEVIKSLVAFKPSFRKVIPSWVNTLSFLLSMYGKPDLLTWISTEHNWPNATAFERAVGGCVSSCEPEG